MEAREKLWKQKDNTKSYLSQINRDWWILKGQLIFFGIFVAVVFIYMLWNLES